MVFRIIYFRVIVYHPTTDIDFDYKSLCQNGLQEIGREILTYIVTYTREIKKSIKKQLKRGNGTFIHKTPFHAHIC